MEGMLESALSLHDTLLLNAPPDARHDTDVCPFCVDWSMAEDGTPSGTGRVEFADAKAPYGSVKYADPGYLNDGVKRYPVDTEAHARAAWSYVHQAKNAARYTADQLSKIRSAIAGALKKFGAEVEEQNQKVQKPAGGSDGTSKRSASKDKSDAASEGGNKHMEDQDTVSKETHDALLDQAVRRATADLTAERDQLAAQVSTLTTERDQLAQQLDTAQADNTRLNGELDTAQVKLTAATEEATSLKTQMAAKETEAAKAEIASARATQVRNLTLFSEDFITERASLWAELPEEEWARRVDEWKQVKGATAGASATATTETASAITGTRDIQPGGQPSARRAVLGLPAQNSA